MARRLTQLALRAIVDESMELHMEAQDKKALTETLVSPCVARVAEVVVGKLEDLFLHYCWYSEAEASFRVNVVDQAVNNLVGQASSVFCQCIVALDDIEDMLPAQIGSIPFDEAVSEAGAHFNQGG